MWSLYLHYAWARMRTVMITPTYEPFLPLLLPSSLRSWVRTERARMGTMMTIMTTMKTTTMTTMPALIKLTTMRRTETLLAVCCCDESYLVVAGEGEIEGGGDVEGG